MSEEKKRFLGYDICPKCMDRLVERKQTKENQTDFEMHDGNYCSKCGSKLVLACVGEKRIDNTIYKISVGEVVGDKRKEALSRLYEKGCIMLEGEMFDIYISMALLDECEITYTVTPQFPFARYIYHAVCLCPMCGGETIMKEEEVKNCPNYIRWGMFCEKCDEWVTQCSTSKLSRDDTIYELTIFLKNIDCDTRQKILDITADLSDKTLLNEKIMIHDKAIYVYEILKYMETNHINYKIEPSFPYIIEEYREVDEKVLNEILELNRRINELGFEEWLRRQ